MSSSVAGLGGNGLVKKYKVPPLFAITVMMPTVVAILYYGLIASDVYVSQSKFVVKSPYHSQSTSLLSQMMSGAGTGSTDSYAVVQYLQSRDALKVLNQDNYIKKNYSLSGDWISRYHTGFDDNLESLWRYYIRNVINPSLDDENSIITLEVNAFDPRVAYQINAKSLSIGESLVNKMNERASRDALAFAEGEVKKAKIQSESAAMALARYRSRQDIFDPNKQSLIQLQQIAGLQEKLLVAQTNLAELTQLSPFSGQIGVITKSVGILKKQIADYQRSVSGREGSLSDKAAEYARLELDAEFSAKLLGNSLAALQLARGQAEKQQVYLERLVEPNLPDKAIKPKKIRAVITTFLAGLMAWAILSLLLESIKEHRD